jgi:hypothetical protein
MCAIIAYLTILGTAVSALFGAPWLGLFAGAAMLSAISIIEHFHLHARFSAAGMADIYQSFTLSNVGTSLVAATAAYVLGSAVRLVAFV